jgi:hypothetical protein
MRHEWEAAFDQFDARERAKERSKKAQPLFLADPAYINSTSGQSRMQEELKKQGVYEELKAEFASICRVYGFLPTPVVLDDERTRLSYLQYDFGSILQKMFVRAYLTHPTAKDCFSLNEALEIAEEMKSFIKRTRPNHNYIPRANPFGLHQFVNDVLPTHFDTEQLTRGRNNQLLYAGKDFLTLVKKWFYYLPFDFLRQACRMLGKEIKYRLSFAQRLFALVRNDTSEKSPRSKVVDGNVFRIVPILFIIRIGIHFHCSIFNYLIGRFGLTDNRPDELGDYPPIKNRPKRKLGYGYSFDRGRRREKMMLVYRARVPDSHTNTILHGVI